jgi:hypothetical protein
MAKKEKWDEREEQRYGSPKIKSTDKVASN